MSISVGLSSFKLTYELCPIVLTGGVAGALPGGMLPIISLSDALNFVSGLLGGGPSLNFDNAFAHFTPLPGGTLIDNAIGNYPFANQQVAANAIIANPLRISLLMTCPAREDNGGYNAKLSTIMGMVQTFQQHNTSGGTYTVMTPANVYDNCIMVGMHDASSGQTKQVQMAYQLDFVKPLITLQDAETAQNSMMSAITSGAQTDGGLSGLQSTVGSPSNPVAPFVLPSAASAGGAGLGITSYNAPGAAYTLPSAANQ